MPVAPITLAFSSWPRPVRETAAVLARLEAEYRAAVAANHDRKAGRLQGKLRRARKIFMDERARAYSIRTGHTPLRERRAGDDGGDGAFRPVGGDRR